MPSLRCSNSHRLSSSLRVRQVLDTIREAKEFAKRGKIIFFSHQWLGWDEPDPKNVLFGCMTRFVRQVAQGGSVDDFWVWVDFRSAGQRLAFHLCLACLAQLKMHCCPSRSCMPQLNKHTRRLAAADLAEIAALSTYFVVVAPNTPHCDKGCKCDLTSYQSQGW